MNRLKKLPVAPSARNQRGDGAGMAALSWPAPNAWPPALVYIARSAMIGTPLVTVITAEISALARPGSSPLTKMVRRLVGATV